MDYSDHLFKIINFYFPKIKISLPGLIHSGVIIIVLVLSMLWLMKILDQLIKKLDHHDKNLQLLLSRLNKTTIISITAIIVLPLFGINLTALSLFGGAIGLGIGFGLQKIASNFLSGFIILFDKSIKINDKIVINNLTGYITKITLRYVVMELTDGSELLIPNEKFISDMVINQSYSNEDLSVELQLTVAYENNLKQIIKLIETAISQIPRIKIHEPTVAIQKINQASIELLIRVWPEDSRNRSTNIKNNLYIAIIELFTIHNIQSPYAKMKINNVDFN